MRRSALCLCAVTLLLAPGAVARASAGHGKATIVRSPSAAAVSRAESSSYLWATINICTDKRAGGTVGVRGEMPTLGSAASLSMTIKLQRYSAATKSYTAISGSTARSSISLGKLSTGVHQAGAEFPFTADPGKVDASVTFTWTRDGTVLGTITQQTTAGHPSAAYGVPSHHSRASCTLGSSSASSSASGASKS